VNTAFFGGYTGSAFNPGNFGMAIDPNNAIAADLFRDLLDAPQQPPNNQTGTVTDGEAGDYITVYPWDGAATDVNGKPEPTFDETTLDGAHTSASTTVTVLAIPVNTPADGFLRVQRDSDLEYDLVEYVSRAGLVYTLGGSTPTLPSAAYASGRNVFRALIDKVWATTGVPESYTAVQTGTEQVAITLLNGGVGPIKPFKGNATFGTAGFQSGAQRIGDG
jgi:hypothetical protein